MHVDSRKAKYWARNDNGKIIVKEASRKKQAVAYATACNVFIEYNISVIKIYFRRELMRGEEVVEEEDFIIWKYLDMKFICLVFPDSEIAETKFRSGRLII